jgi:hypothetical protein
MISRTISIIAANWWFYLFFAAVILVSVAAVDAGIVKSGSGVVNTMLWLMFARFVHHASLYGVKFGAPNPDGTPYRPFDGFVWRGLALLFLSLVLALPLIYAAGPAAPYADPALPNLLPFIIAVLIIYAILLSLVGSWLPASAYKQNTSLGAAFKRGRKNFFRVLLWIAPTLLVAVVVEFTLLIGSIFSGVHVGVVHGGSFDPAGTLLTLVITLIESVSVSLISVVLSHFYLEAEGVEEPALKS